MNHPSRQWIVFIVRFYLGGLFLLVGAGRMFFTGIPSFIERLQTQFASTPLPDPFLWGFGTTLPFVEVGVGSLLLVGLYRRQTLVATALLLVVLSLGQIMIQNLGMAANNTTYLLVALAGLFLVDEPFWAVDGLLRTDPC